MVRSLLAVLLFAQLLPLTALAQAEPLAPGKNALTQAKWDEALTFFTQVLAQQPQDVTARFYRGYAGQKHVSEALERDEPHLGQRQTRARLIPLAKQVIADFSAVLQVDPKCVQALVGRAEMSRRVFEEQKQALADCEAALAAAPGLAEARFQRGSTLMLSTDAKEHQRALADLTEYLRLQPNDYRGPGARGYLYLQMEQTPPALADIGTALRLRPNDGKLLFFRGMAQARADQHAAAKADFDLLVARPEKALRCAGYQGWFMLYAAQQNIEQAVAAVDRALAVDEQIAFELLEMRAELLYHTTKDYARIIADCTRYVALEPARTAEVYLLRAVCLCHGLRYEQALPDFHKAIQLKPDYQSAYRNRALALYILKREREAMVDCEACLRLEPRDGVMLGLRGALHRQLGKDELALADYTAALAAGFRQAQAYHGRGELYHRLKQHAAALADLNEAIRLDAKDDSLYETRGTIHLALGDHAKALADFKTSAQLNSSNRTTVPLASMASGNEAELQQSLANLEKAPESQRNAFWYFQRAALRLHLKQFDQPLLDCTRVLELDPTDAEARHNRAACYLNLGQFDQAIADCNVNLALPKVLADYYGTRSLAYYAKQDYAQALKDIDEAIRLAPKLGLWYENRARVWYKLGEPAKADADLAKCLALGKPTVLHATPRGISFGMTMQLAPPLTAPVEPKEEPVPPAPPVAPVPSTPMLLQPPSDSTAPPVPPKSSGKVP